jgi:hypothetical protein
VIFSIIVFLASVRMRGRSFDKADWHSCSPLRFLDLCVFAA